MLITKIGQEPTYALKTANFSFKLQIFKLLVFSDPQYYPSTDTNGCFILPAPGNKLPRSTPGWKTGEQRQRRIRYHARNTIFHSLSHSRCIYMSRFLCNPLIAVTFLASTLIPQKALSIPLFDEGSWRAHSVYTNTNSTEPLSGISGLKEDNSGLQGQNNIVRKTVFLRKDDDNLGYSIPCVPVPPKRPINPFEDALQLPNTDNEYRKINNYNSFFDGDDFEITIADICNSMNAYILIQNIIIAAFDYCRQKKKVVFLQEFIETNEKLTDLEKLLKFGEFYLIKFRNYKERNNIVNFLRKYIPIK